MPLYESILFLEYHYLLELNLASPREAERWVQGFLKFNLYGTKGEKLDLDLTPEYEKKIKEINLTFALISRNIQKNYQLYAKN